LATPRLASSQLDFVLPLPLTQPISSRSIFFPLIFFFFFFFFFFEKILKKTQFKEGWEMIFFI